MIMYFVKRYILSQINSLIKKYRKNVDEFRTVLENWIERIQKILEALKSINNRLDDGELDQQELNSSVDDIQKVIKEW